MNGFVYLVRSDDVFRFVITVYYWSRRNTFLNVLASNFPVIGCACICTKSGQQPVDWLHSIENTHGCKCQFFIDSEFGRSTNRYTRSPDNSLTHFNSNPVIRLAATCCDAANKGDELENWSR